VLTLPVRLLTVGPEPLRPLGSIMYDDETADVHYATRSEWRMLLSSTAGVVCLEDQDGDTHVCVDDGADNDIIAMETPAAGGVDVDVGSAGFLVDTTGQLNLDSAQDAADAVRINAGHVDGGIDIDAGTTGVAVDTTGGISLDAGADSNFTVNGSDLTLNSVLGSVIVSAGEAVADAIQLVTTDLAGGLRVDVGSGGSGGVDLDAGTDGVDVDTTGQLNLDSAQDASDAIRIFASHADGGIEVESGTTGINVDSTGQISLDSSQAGANDAIRLTAVGAGSGIVVEAGDTGVDVDASGRIDIDSSQDASDAVRIAASHADGGVDVEAGTEGVSVTTTDGTIFLTPTGATNTTSVTGLRVTAGSISGTTTLTELQSGTTFDVTQTVGAYTITLPSLEGSIPPGLSYRFFILTDAAGTTSVATGAGAVMRGTIVNDTATVTATGTNINFVGGTAVVGDNLEVYSTSTHWFARAVTSAAGGITAT